jgi:hypothetical protein
MLSVDAYSIRKSDVVLTAINWLAASTDLPVHVSLFQESHGGFKAILRSGETAYDDDAELREAGAG